MSIEDDKLSLFSFSTSEAEELSADSSSATAPYLPMKDDDDQPVYHFRYYIQDDMSVFLVGSKVSVRPRTKS